MQQFNIIPPSPALCRYIRYYWILQTDAADAVTERTFPEGCIQLFFHKRSPLFSLADQKLQPRNFICGHGDGYTDICTTGAVEMLVVVFQPHAAKLFFRKPLSLFQGEHVAVEDLEDRALAELTRKIADTQSHTGCIALIEEFLLRRLAMGPDYNVDRLGALLRHINLDPYMDVGQLANAACLSTKQLTRIFAEYIGASPKEFLRIIRIQRALFLLQQNPQYNFAQVAYGCGFADQSHMIREFKLFTGYTPLEYMAVCAPQSDYFSNPF